MRPILLTALAISAIAGAASAAPPATDGGAVQRRLIALDALKTGSPAAPPLTYASRAPARIPGIAQTSLSTRFSKRDDAFGDAGLLCGLQPHPDTAGAAAAFGHDPDGKFVGAKLRLAF